MKFAPDNKALSALWFTDRAAAAAKCREALKKHDGNRARAASELGISTRVLYRWLKKYPEIGKGVRGARPLSTPLTAAKVRMVKTSKKSGAELARELDVSESSISLIRAGRRRKAS